MRVHSHRQRAPCFKVNGADYHTKDRTMNGRKIFKSTTEKLVLEAALVMAFMLCLLVMSSIFGQAYAADFSDKATCEQAVITLGAKAMEAPLPGDIQTSVLGRLDALLEACSSDLKSAEIEYDAIANIVQSAGKS